MVRNERSSFRHVAALVTLAALGRTLARWSVRENDAPRDQPRPLRRSA